MKPIACIRNIAWTPLLKPQHIPLVAIRCHPSQLLDRDIYLHLLGVRIQGLVDCIPPTERKRAVRDFQEEMFRTGLVLEVGYCPADEVGNRLVESNPGIWEPLTNMGVFRRLTNARHPLVENLMAHQALSSEKDDPECHLIHWAAQAGAGA
jgi:hypothetical protein